MQIKGKDMNSFYSFCFGVPEPHPTHTEVPQTVIRYQNMNKEGLGNYKDFLEFWKANRKLV